MAGTREGGLKAAAKNKANDPNFYSKIGAKGGSKSNNGGFAANIVCNCDLIRGEHYIKNCAGQTGGKKSRRTRG